MMYASFQENKLAKLVFPFLLSLDQGPIYLVGGSVRDAILEIPSHDLDFIVTGDVFSIARKLADFVHGAFYILDKERSYARVIFIDEDGVRNYFDFAPVYQNDLETDLRSRDFSMNAIAWDIASPFDVFIDPCCGGSDLQKKILRPCSPSSFLDDPVRVIRSVRFAVGYGLGIPDEVKCWITDAKSGLETISAERKRDELFKILENHHTTLAMEMLRELDLLPSLLPEAARLVEFTQNGPHIFDGWQHTLHAMNYCEAMVDHIEDNGHVGEFPEALQDVFRLIDDWKPGLESIFKTDFSGERSQRALFLFAALHHDIGKPMDNIVMVNGRKKYPHHARLGAGAIENRARLLALSRMEIQWLKRFIASHMLLHDVIITDDKVEQNRQLYQFFKHATQTSPLVALFSLADLLATYGDAIPAERWQLGLTRCQLVLAGWFEQFDVLVEPQLFLNGDDLQIEFGMEPGRNMGSLIERMREAQAAGVIHSKDEAQAWVKKTLDRKE